MELTTEKLIKILPFDEGFRHELLNKLVSMDHDEKYLVQRAVWSFYDALYNLLLDQKIALALHDSNGLRLDKEFYKNVRKEVEEEMLQSNTTTISQVDLTNARKELEALKKSSTS